MAARIDEDDELAESHEINVTPFIDVILVLLIVFMVAAPLATVDVPVELPSATEQPAARPDKPVFVTMRADRSVLVADQAVTAADLAASLDAATGHDRTQPIFLRADTSVPYGALMAVMETLRRAGYVRIGLVALQAGDAP